MKKFENKELGKDLNMITENGYTFGKTGGSTTFFISLTNSSGNEAYIYYDEATRDADFELLTEKIGA